ncbi:MAG: MMPL family transporter [Acidobacteriota bacterium]
MSDLHPSTGPSPDTPKRALRASRAWARWLTAHGRLLVAVVVLLALGAAALAAFRLQLRPGHLELLSEDSRVSRDYFALIDELDNVEALHLLVSAPAESDAAAFLAELGPELERLGTESAQAEGSVLVDRVLWRFPTSWWLARLPAWLPGDQLGGGTPTTAGGAAAIDPEPAALLAGLGDLLDELEESAADSGETPEQALAGLPLLAGFLDELTLAAGGEDAAPSGALGRLAELGLDRRGHFRIGDATATEDTRPWWVGVWPADRENDPRVLTAVVDATQEVLDRLLPRHPTVEVALTGAPALIAAEMEATTRDITRSTLLALLLVGLLFPLSFGSWRHVVAAFVALLLGLALTSGLATLLVGSLNLFSSVFAAVLVGLGIDFSIHLVTAFETRLSDTGREDALARCLAAVAPALVVGATTTAAAFLATANSDFRGFSELGLITGVGILTCLLLALSFLPALLLRGPDTGSGPRARTWSRPLWVGAARRPRGVLLVGLPLLALVLLGLPRLRFDHDVLALQAADSPAMLLARDPDSGLSTHLAVSLADDLEQARERHAELAALPGVARVQSVVPLLPELDASRRTTAAGLAARRLAPTTSDVADAPALNEAALALVDRLFEWQDLAFEGGLDDLVGRLDPLVAAAERRVEATAPDAVDVDGLTRFREAARDELSELLAVSSELARGEGLDIDSLPTALRDQLVGRSGRLALWVEPAESVWDRDALGELVAALRTIDPDVTGPAVQVYEVPEEMRRSCVEAGLLAFVAVTLLVLLTSRDLAVTGLALLTVALGLGTALGLLAWMGQPLNPANLLALPLLLGIGIDDGVHLAWAWKRCGRVDAALAEVGHPIALTSLTTAFGFAGLLLADHRGLQSLGLTCVIGCLTMLLCSTTLLPAVLGLLGDRRR